jgi:hypothetical protein
MLDRGQLSASCCGRFSPWETFPLTISIRSLVNAKSGLNVMAKKKISSPPGNQILSVQLVANHFDYSVIPVNKLLEMKAMTCMNKTFLLVVVALLDFIV